MTSAQTLAGAMPAMQVDGPLMGDTAFAVLKKFAQSDHLNWRAIF
jgi:hypothetical protein